MFKNLGSSTVSNHFKIEKKQEKFLVDLSATSYFIALNIFSEGDF